MKLGFDTYFSKPRKYHFEGVEAIVNPDVFPPHLTISTKILLNYIKLLNLKNKTFLELGCGSGIVSLYAAKKGAIVTASDINNSALEALGISSKQNNLAITVLFSDLFDKLSGKRFDYIIINPPYYPKKPKNIKEQAWYCGENFEYFEHLFAQLPKHLDPSNNVLMILSEDCHIEKINSIALKNNLTFQSVLEKKVMKEKNYIFKIVFHEKVA